MERGHSAIRIVDYCVVKEISDFENIFENEVEWTTKAEIGKEKLLAVGKT